MYSSNNDDDNFDQKSSSHLSFKVFKIFLKKYLPISKTIDKKSTEETKTNLKDKWEAPPSNYRKPTQKSASPQSSSNSTAKKNMNSHPTGASNVSSGSSAQTSQTRPATPVNSAQDAMNSHPTGANNASSGSAAQTSQTRPAAPANSVQGAMNSHPTGASNASSGSSAQTSQTRPATPVNSAQRAMNSHPTGASNASSGSSYTQTSQTQPDSQVNSTYEHINSDSAAINNISSTSNINQNQPTNQATHNTKNSDLPETVTPPVYSFTSSLMIKFDCGNEQVKIPSLKEFFKNRIPNESVDEKLENIIEENSLELKISDNSEISQILGFANLPVKDDNGFTVKITNNSNILNETCHLMFSDSKSDLKVTVITTIIARKDPKSLWKDIPVPINLPFRKNNTDTYYGTAADGRSVIGASKRGRSHAHVGSPRDDDFSVMNNVNGWDIYIVCDGAGSAKYSRRGSEITCQIIRDECHKKLSNPNCKLNSLFTDLINSNVSVITNERRKELKLASYEILCSAAFSAKNRITEEAKQCDPVANPRDFATTLLLMITRKVGNYHVFLSFSIGDGAIAVYSKENQACFKLMNTPDSGEFAGQTRFLTSHDFSNTQDLMNRITIHVAEQFTSIMLMTDGVSDAMFESEEKLADYSKWTLLWNNLTEIMDNHIVLNTSPDENAEKLLNWLDFWSVGNHDDRTIVVVY